MAQAAVPTVMAVNDDLLCSFELLKVRHLAALTGEAFTDGSFKCASLHLASRWASIEKGTCQDASTACVSPIA